MVEIDDYMASPKYSRTGQAPVMLHISGDFDALDKIATRACGPIDLPPVDFAAWALKFAPMVREGFDPLRIEEGARELLIKAGVEDPVASVRRTESFARSRHMRMRFRNAQSPPEIPNDIPGHGAALPGSVIDPTITRQERCAAFEVMLTQMEQEGCAPLDDVVVPISEFGVANLVPLPPAERLPSWCSRHAPMRNEAKLETWGSYGGGLTNAEVTRISPSQMRVVGNAETREGLALMPFVKASKLIAEFYEVDVDLTLWGRSISFTSQGTFIEKETLLEGMVVSSSEPHGIRSAGQLAQIISIKRMQQATECMEAIRQGNLHPSASHTMIKIAFSGGVATLGAKDRVRAEIHGIKRTAGRLLGKARPKPPAP